MFDILCTVRYVVVLWRNLGGSLFGDHLWHLWRMRLGFPVNNGTAIKRREREREWFLFWQKLESCMDFGFVNGVQYLKYNLHIYFILKNTYLQLFFIQIWIISNHLNVATHLIRVSGSFNHFQGCIMKWKFLKGWRCNVRVVLRAEG